MARAIEVLRQFRAKASTWLKQPGDGHGRPEDQLDYLLEPQHLEHVQDTSQGIGNVELDPVLSIHHDIENVNCV